MAERASVRNQSSAAAPPPNGVAAARISVLDRVVVGTLTLEKCLYIAVFSIAVFTRLYNLGVRPYHHDESIHAFYSWKITQDGVSSYNYDPVYHGPILYYSTALCTWLFGDNDFTGRLSAVLFGLGCLAFAWPLRRYLGRWGAFCFLALFTFSPALNYFTRFVRHDIYVALGNMMAVFFVFRYGETRRARDLYLSAAGFAIAFCNKEDMYAMGPVLVLALALMLLWEVVYADDWRGQLRTVWGESSSLLRQSLLPLLTSFIVFALIWLTFYTSFFTHNQNWFAADRALSYWMGQHEIKRIGGPWWYYFPQIFIYEPLIFFPALVLLLAGLSQPRRTEGTATKVIVYAAYALAAAFFVTLFVDRERAVFVLLAALAFAGVGMMRRWLPDRFLRYMIIWTVGAFGFYSWAQEKVPWLLVPILVPAVVLAARWFGDRIEAGQLQKPSMALPLGAVGALTIWTLIASNYLYDAPVPAEVPGPRHAELLAYVQSTYDTTDVVMRRIETVAKTLGTGTKTRLAVSGNATWPLSWYLRHYPVNWGADVRQVDTAVVVIDKEATQALDKSLAEKYEKINFQIRGWWEPDWGQFNIPNLIRYLFTREAFSGVGSSDAVMYVAKDLSAGMQFAAIAVNPPPAARPYSKQPELLQPSAVWGHRGDGQGEFDEPRALATDAEDNLYVADSKNHRIQKLRADGTALQTWGGEGNTPGKFKDPCGIAIGRDGIVYVADTWNHRVQKFDGSGKFLLEWKAQTGFWGPRGIAVAPDNSAVYVTDTGNKRVVKFDTSGNELLAWGKDGSKPGELIEPVGIAVNKAGQVIVADTGNHRMQYFDSDGKFVKEHFVAGWDEFYTEPYLAMLDDDVLATDSYAHRAARYSNGQLAYVWGKSGGDSGYFNRPIGITADSKGTVYVADTMNHRIQKFTLPPLQK